MRHYSSAGTWRAAQALTYLWDRDLKDVLDEKIMGKIGIAPDDWEWMIGRDVQRDRDFYPAMPNSWDYLDPPYEINGHPVRSGPGLGGHEREGAGRDTACWWRPGADGRGSSSSRRAGPGRTPAATAAVCTAKADGTRRWAGSPRRAST